MNLETTLIKILKLKNFTPLQINRSEYHSNGVFIVFEDKKLKKEISITISNAELLILLHSLL